MDFAQDILSKEKIAVYIHTLSRTPQGVFVELLQPGYIDDMHHGSVCVQQ